MATFIKIDDVAGGLILAAVLIGGWFLIAPESATETAALFKEAIMGVAR